MEFMIVMHEDVAKRFVANPHAPEFEKLEKILAENGVQLRHLGPEAIKYFSLIDPANGPLQTVLPHVGKKVVERLLKNDMAFVIAGAYGKVMPCMKPPGF